MLNEIPGIFSPELMKILMEMGHGDELVIADGNFPAVSNAQRLVRADGHNVPELLEAILRCFPLDIYVDKPVSLMSVVRGDDTKPAIWEEYRKLLKPAEKNVMSLNLWNALSFMKEPEKLMPLLRQANRLFMQM